MARKMEYAEARRYAIETVRNFLDGTGGDWDSDDFISLPLGHQDLEDLQQFCSNLSFTYPPEKGGGYCSEKASANSAPGLRNPKKISVRLEMGVTGTAAVRAA
jgi:hypothetical protein